MGFLDRSQFLQRLIIVCSAEHRRNMFCHFEYIVMQMADHPAVTRVIQNVSPISDLLRGTPKQRSNIAYRIVTAAHLWRAQHPGQDRVSNLGHPFRPEGGDASYSSTREFKIFVFVRLRDLTLRWIAHRGGVERAGVPAARPAIPEAPLWRRRVDRRWGEPEGAVARRAPTPDATKGRRRLPCSSLFG